MTDPALILFEQSMDAADSIHALDQVVGRIRKDSDFTVLSDQQKEELGRIYFECKRALEIVGRESE